MPGTLSRAGIEQGEKLTLRLKDEKIDAIFSSDLKRAADTAKIIGKCHPRIKVKYTKDLREGDGGNWTGRPNKGLDWNNRPANSESVEQMKARAKKFLDQLCEKYSNKTILLVAHATFNRVLITQITGVKDPFKNVPDQHNTAVNIFEIFEDGSHKIHCLNCIKHLNEK